MRRDSFNKGKALEMAAEIERIKATRAAMLAARSKLGDPDPKVRAEAAIALDKMNARAAMLAVLPKLGDPDPKVRAEAAIALAKMNAREAVPEIRRLLVDQDTQVRRALLIALNLLGDNEVLSIAVDRERKATDQVTRKNYEDFIAQHDSAGERACDEMTRVLLTKRTGELDLRDIPLEDALRSVLRFATPAVKYASPVNLYVNWAALERIKVTRTTRVTLTISDVPVAIGVCLCLGIRQGATRHPWFKIIDEGVPAVVEGW